MRKFTEKKSYTPKQVRIVHSHINWLTEKLIDYQKQVRIVHSHINW